MKFEHLAVRIEMACPGKYGVFVSPADLRATIVNELLKAEKRGELMYCQGPEVNAQVLWSEDVQTVERMKGPGGQTWFRLGLRKGGVIEVNRDLLTRMICAE